MWSIRVLRGPPLTTNWGGGGRDSVSIDETFNEEGAPVVSVTLEELLELPHSMDLMSARGHYFEINERIQNGGNIHTIASTFPFDHPQYNTPQFNALIPTDLNNYSINPHLLQPVYRHDNSLMDSESDGLMGESIEIEKEESEWREGW